MTPTLPLSRFLAAERRAIVRDYPDADREAIRETLASKREQWFADCAKYERGEIIPAAVYRSYRYHLGPQEATRTFRYAGNFAQLANLPVWLGDGELPRPGERI